MNADELEALLDDLEAGLREDVQAALTLTAQDFADAVDDADELVAAAFSVSRIRDMWRRRVGGIMTRLRRIAGRGAVTVTDDLDTDDIPPAELDAALAPYMDATESLLNAVGDRLAADATASLAEGVAAGESLDELKARMTALFSDDGTELGPGRAERIAATEATRAFNAGALQAAELLTGPERPIVKQWRTRRDNKVREAHADADGQIQLLADPFDVGGVPMQYPGDPAAPASLTINCRCILRTQVAPATEGTASMTADGTAADGSEEFQSRMPAQLKRYWLTGEGAAKIRWGTPGDFTRCVRNLRDDFPEDTEGLCANLHHEATGMWPGDARNNSVALNPDGTVHTGAMIALVPSEEDIARLAVDGGEPADQLHLTLYFLGEAEAWDEQSQSNVHEWIGNIAGALQPVRANVFGVSQWNTASDEPAWVWNVGDDNESDGPSLTGVRDEVSYALDGSDRVPAQHSPWSPHVTATYGEADHATLADRVGPVTFDRIRVAFGGYALDFPLTGESPESVPDMTETATNIAEATVPPLLTWSTPGTSALAFENQQTGDGRVFAPGALYWSGDGPWPLQYADEMQGGHDGAELAGAIHTMARDGDRITGDGVLYLTQRAGGEAAMLLSQGAPLGVSVDLDDVDLEAVAVDGGELFTASLVRASMMPLPDGGFALSGVTVPDITASSDSSTMVLEERRVTMLVGPDGLVPAAAFEITAAAGDPDAAGTVVDVQRSGDMLMRITRARVRGATLVTIPAYAEARIVLDDESVFAAAATPATVTASGVQLTDYDKAIRHVRRSLHPLGASDVAQFLKIQIVAARRYLARAAKRGDLVRLTRGKYVAPTVAASVADAAEDVAQLVASVTGAVDLPVADRDATWDGDAAATRVFEWADGDVSKIAKAFAYRDDDADPLTKAAYKLGYADVDDGELTIIPAGVSAAIGALNGARGGVDLPADERPEVEQHMQNVAAHVAEELNGDDMEDMSASAWTALADLPPMPAGWFREPTPEELPDGGPGVNYAGGRIFGWVAQAGSQHAGFAKKVTIDGLGRIDTSHFLRQRFTLDDGSIVKAGAYTMNAGHHRDGAECETAACQFDDTRTVAGIVTVGMNERGMWFSGAAAPWMSEWDRKVFMATQPSYHMKRGSSGGWELRAVLSVPVPGHSSPLLASAVVERSQMALTAAAMQVDVEAAVTAEKQRQEAEDASVPADASSLAELVASAVEAALDAREQCAAREAAELETLLAEGRDMLGE